jgi:polysaccharide biosynthesis transport protein
VSLQRLGLENPMNAPPEQFITQAHQGYTSFLVPGRKPDPIGSVKGHRKIALATMLVIAVVGLSVAIKFGHAQYMATASIRVTPTFDARLATGMDPSLMANVDYSSFVQQQVFEIDNIQTISDALQLLGSKGSLWRLPNESEQHAAERLVNALKVEWLPNTFLITVSLKGSKPQGLDDIVNAVVTAYLDRQEKQELNGADTRVRLLNQRRATLVQQTAAERSQLSQLAQELDVSTFASGLSDPHDRMLANATEALDRERRNLIVQQARLAALQAEQKQLPNSDLNSFAEKTLTSDPDVISQKSALEKQRVAAFLQLQGLARGHPGRPVLEQQIADIDREIGQIESKTMERTRSVLLSTRTAEWRDKIVDAQTRVDEAQMTCDGIEKEVTTLKATIATFGAKYNQALVLHEQFENHTKELSDIDDRIDLMRLQSQSPGEASIELPAQLPDQPEGGKRRIIFGLSILMAIALGIGVPTVIDLADSRVMTSRELETILQMPVLGSNLRSSPLYPRETLRRIALAILRERRQSGTRVFVVSGVDGKAGASSLTLALSNELTELGAATVAVEANAHSPDPRYQKRLAKSSNSLIRYGHNGSINGPVHVNGKNVDGSSELTLVHRNPVEACIHTITQASDALPDRVSICQRQKHQRLAMTCLREVLDIALASHDLVLIDAPPVLSSADTTMLVQNPAGVILVVREGRDRLEDVVASVQELNKLSPPVVGIVLQSGHMSDLETNAHQIPDPDESKRTTSRSPGSSISNAIPITMNQ